MDARAPSISQRILDDITEKIVSGEWQPGHRVPFENELVAEYQCSRMTVNKAMTQLARSGLIERRRRSGSFVARPRSQAAVLEIHDIRAEVQALDLPYRYELVSRRTRRATAADRRLLEADGRLLALTCQHFAGGRPFCLEERLISLESVPEAAEESFAEIAPSSWLIARVPWSAAEHTIRAVAADATIAAGLDIAEGTACLVVERRTWSNDLPVTFVGLTYAGDSHALVARFAPN